MALFYRLYQNKNEKNAGFNKWYARAVTTEVTTTSQLAEIMQENCTVKRSDIEAVLRELVPTMTRAMQDSKRVKIDGLGSFRFGLKTSPSATAKDFSAIKNIKGMHIIFTPERYKDRNTGVYVTDMYSRCNIMELPKNTIIDEAEAEGGEVTNP